MDKRRSRWIAFDVYFFDDDLGIAIRDRFGPVGLTLFMAFLCACKRNSIQGRFRYTSDVEALMVLGLPGLELVNEQGEAFTLDDFWTLLGQRKQTRRTRRGRITDVVSTRWERWQKGYGTKAGDEQTSRSDPENTEQIDDESEAITALDPDPDIDPDKDTDIDSPSAASAGPLAAVGADGDVLLQACRLLAEREADRLADSIHSRPGWVRKRITKLTVEHEAEARRVLSLWPGTSAEKLARHLRGEPNAVGDRPFIPGSGFLGGRAS